MRKLKDLPNQDGYEFTGITVSGSVPCKVMKGEDGLHHVSGVEYDRLIGWETHEETHQKWFRHIHEAPW
jgi:hypothetical protein